MRAIAQKTACAVTASLALLSSAAQASSCWYPQETKAAQLRDFNIMLMVGTLQCKSINNFVVQDYNSFVSRQSAVLDTNSRLLKNHFQRDVGPMGVDLAYDRYSTESANTLEPKVLTDPATCARIDMLARVAAVADVADLMVLAQTFSARQLGSSCPPPVYPVADTALIPADTGAVAAAAPPHAPDALPGAAPTAAPAMVKVAEAASPPPAAAEPPAPPQPDPPAPARAATPSPSDPGSMTAAIVALQAAVTALQAAMPAKGTAPTASARGAPKAELIAVKVQEAPIVPPRD